MNININRANPLYHDLCGRSNITEHIGKTIGFNSASSSHEGNSKNLTLTVSSVSISNEARALLQQQFEEGKNLIPERELKSRRSEIVHKGYGILLGYTDDGRKIMDMDYTYVFEDDKQRLIHYAYLGHDSKEAGTLDFDKLTSGYEEIRKELEDQYTGDELEKRLNVLSGYYNETLDYIANDVKDTVSYWEKKEGNKGATKAIETLFGMNMNKMNELINKMDIDKNQPFLDFVDIIVKFLAQWSRESSNEK